MQPYGGFWWRVLAYIVDTIILNIVISIISGILGLGIGAGMAMVESGQESILSGAVLMSTLISLVLTWLYFALMESSPLQATLGKLVVGVVVTDLGGNRLTFGRATGRYFAKILSSLIL